MNFIFFDRTMCTANIDTMFFRYCLLRQPSLIKYLPGRWLFGLLHIFGLVREERYCNRRWRFLKSVRGPLDRAERFWQRRRPKVYDIFHGEDNLWITRWPEAVMLPLAGRLGAVLVAPSFDLVDGRFSHYEDTAALYRRALKNYRPRLAADAPRELIPTGLETVHVFRGHVYSTAARCRTAQLLHGLVTFVILLALGVLLGMAGLYFGTASFSHDVFLSVLAHPGTVMLNLLPGILLIFLFFFIFNRVWSAFSLTALATLALSLTSWFKLAAFRDPFTAADMRTFSDVFRAFPHSVGEAGSGVLLGIGICVLAALASALVVRSRVVSPKLRFSGLLAVLCLVIFSYFTLYTNDSIYASAADALPPGEETLQYVSRGCVYPFLHSIKAAEPEPPAGYDELATVRAFSRYVTEDIPVEDKVSLVFVMADSFADLSELDCLDLRTDVYRPLHMLQKDSVYGSLISDVFAGDAIVTERSVLTGSAADLSFRSDASSYVRYFVRQGYDTFGCCTDDALLFNRVNVNGFLGFSDYRFCAGSHGTSETDFFAGVRSLCEEHAAQSDAPYFCFSVTDICSAPYPSDSNLFGRSFIAPGTLTDEQRNVVNNYLGAVGTTVSCIADLADYLDERPEPVILVVFGGHLPDLGEDVYAAIDANIAEGKHEGFLNRFKTPYLIHANPAAEYVLNVDFCGEGRTVSPCFLFNELFSWAGWGGTAYMKAAGELMEEVPVAHSSGRFVSDGELTRELSEAAREKLDFYDYVSYYRRRNYADYR